MPQLLTPDTFEFFARYLLAGYIVIIVRSRFVAGLSPKPMELFFEAVIFSLIVQLLMSLGIALISAFGWSWASSVFFQGGENEHGAEFFISVLFLPAMLGLFLGRNLQAGWKNALLRRLSLPVVHPSRTGYDYWFGNQPDPCIVIISYFDGTTVAGYFGPRSLAASNPEPRDILLEYLYTIDEDGELDEPTIKRAALISLANVRSIEFLKTE